jgi:hypothetical protein
VAERPVGHAKKAGRLGMNAVGAAQGFFDIASLDFLDVFFQIETLIRKRELRSNA